jgi:ribonuclease BN (tRNA processing enzyme)
VTRFDTPDCALVYSGDTGPGSDLRDLAEGADVLLCEATLVGERDDGTYPYHLTAQEAGRIAADAWVRTLVLTHLAAGNDQEQSLGEAAAAYAGEIILAMPGVTITIGEDR